MTQNVGSASHRLPTKPTRGAILVIAACGALLFLGLLALVTDIGWIYFQQIKLQGAIYAGWKAGMDELCTLRASPDGLRNQSRIDGVKESVKAVIALNYPQASPPAVIVSIDAPRDSSRLFLTVKGTRECPSFFARLFGIPAFQLETVRKNGPDPAEDTGIIPLAIPHGEVKQPHPGAYTCTLFQGNEGFLPGRDYLLVPEIGNSVEGTPNNASSSFLDARRVLNSGGIDPDNCQSATDSLEFEARLIQDFFQPIQLENRLILQPEATPRTIRTGLATRFLRGRTVIVLPITDIPPEVASAAKSPIITIYDLQGKDSPGGRYSPSEFPFTSAVRVIGFAEFELLKPEPLDAGPVCGRFIRYLIRPGVPPEAFTPHRFSVE